MLTTYDRSTVNARLLALADRLFAEVDPDFDAAGDDLDREFQELRLQLVQFEWEGAMTPTDSPNTNCLAEIRGRPLSPDPDGLNDRRAEWAASALTAFLSQTGTDAESAVTDLLCDLIHLADRDGTAFDADLRRGRMHYACETGAAEPADLYLSTFTPSEKT